MQLVVMPVSCQGSVQAQGGIKASQGGVQAQGGVRPREEGVQAQGVVRPREASGPGRRQAPGGGCPGPGGVRPWEGVSRPRARQAPLGLEVTRVYVLSTVLCDVHSCDTQVHLHI